MQFYGIRPLRFIALHFLFVASFIAANADEYLTISISIDELTNLIETNDF